MFCAFILVSCNTNEVIDTSGVYLSKVITNGYLSTEYKYIDSLKLVDTICQYDFQGKLATYQTFKYANGKLFRSYNYTSAKALVGVYKYKFDSISGNIKQSDYCLAADTTKINTTNIYKFNSQSMCDTVFYVDMNGISYKTINNYTNGNRVQATVLSHDSIKATINYAYDSKPTFAQKLSTYPFLYCTNNIKSISSADILTNGGSITTSGVGSVKIFSGAGKYLFLGFDLTESTYEYNANGLPTKQVAIYTHKTDNIITTEYQYISLK